MAVAVRQTSSSGPGDGLINRVLQHADIAVAIGVVMVVVMMVLPLPPVLLDVLITINLAVALTVMLLSLYTQDALDLSVFPSLLLFTTLYRLAINISVTRLILLHGDGGSVIHAFGSFVVGGNVVVGLVVFLIIVVIQFVVITNGAGRVAEVAARFTLDAMPGKQMAIDADLNAGQITDGEARARRDKIQREADFYGAMDGASKFVKGDAVAGIVIVGINLLAGITIGMLMQGKGFGDAVSTFSLLSIGDGLAAQIPALLISTATGIIVTRAATDGDTNLGADVAQQLLRHSRPLLFAAAVLGLLGLVPGLPKIPFLMMAVIMGGARLRRPLQAAERGRAAGRGRGGRRAEGAAATPGRRHQVAQPRHARARDRLRPDPARGRERGRRAAEARRRSCASRWRRSSASCCSRSGSATTSSSRRTSTPSGSRGPRSRAASSPPAACWR